MFTATCVAPVNMALVKYWGKRNEELILPINDSISMTLDANEMCAKTTVAASESFKENRMWLNGDEQPFQANARLQRCLDGVQRLALAHGGAHRFPLSWKVHIASHNNFPTAAGLASSAAGYACLVYTLARLYDVPLDEQLTTIARQGSGSACRSLYGGFVQWQRGSSADGSDSIAVQLSPATHWPNMHMLILVVNDARKKTGSTSGMQRAVETSALIQHRATQVVPQRSKELKVAIEKRDFNAFATITMKESNQLHAIALDTFPPCVYMNDVSHSIVNFVHEYNEEAGSLHVAYTFDAGPNGCLYVLDEHVPHLLAAIQLAFPNDAQQSVEYLKGIPVPAVAVKNGFGENSASVYHINARNTLKYIIHTKIGEGPCQLGDEKSLLIDGLPLPK
ncbi:diphosphomevalonate decarboxylase [Drosophila grimshawi]|uniref:Diphosphomevalonate decarboxylase n=1 Tax=Drosophila grimshawi TaxID=7222 RepID=B4J7I0_DROGR|nr:diphosphomevalonate decarboxylase [Drosophila grimshawi]EDW01104.1 GH20637 [Drosophila grimshawi]